MALSIFAVPGVALATRAQIAVILNNFSKLTNG